MSEVVSDSFILKVNKVTESAGYVLSDSFILKVNKVTESAGYVLSDSFILKVNNSGSAPPTDEIKPSPPIEKPPITIPPEQLENLQQALDQYLISLKYLRGKMQEAQNMNAYEISKEYTNAQIKLTSDSITQSVSKVYATKTDVEGMSTSVSSLIERVNTAEQKITSDAIVSTVVSSTAYKDSISGKIEKNEIISTINQTAEAIKIQASKIQLDGATTIGSDNRYIKIEEANYSVFNGNNTCVRMGYKNWNGWDGTPEFLMGYAGFKYTTSATSDQNGSYFGMSAWGRSNNPEGTSNSYHEMYYRCGKSASQSQIKMYENGVIKIDAVKTLELFANKQNYIVIDSTNGLTFPKGVNEFGVIDGTVWLKNYYFGVKMGKYGSAEDFYFCKATDRIADLGHSNYRWRNIYATNGTINTSDIKLKENIVPIVNEHNEPLKAASNHLTSEDFYQFVKDLPLYSYDYKSETPDRSLHNIGFIAQDIANTPVGDEFVFKGEDGIYQYNMQGYVGVLAVALQNAIKEIESLKEEIKQLKTTF